MAFNVKKLKKLQATLGPQEPIVAGALAFAPGGVRRQQTKAGLFGAAGAAMAARKTQQAGSLQLPNVFYVGLSPQRVLFVGQGAWSGQGRADLLAAIPRTDIVAAGFTNDKRVRGVQIVTRNGATVDFEVRAGRQRQWMEELLAHLQVPAPYPAA